VGRRQINGLTSVFFVARTTGFEPATLTLAINKPTMCAQLLYLRFREIAAA
jgi:hypothetical protein